MIETTSFTLWKEFSKSNCILIKYIDILPEWLISNSIIFKRKILLALANFYLVASILINSKSSITYDASI